MFTSTYTCTCAPAVSVHTGVEVLLHFSKYIKWRYHVASPPIKTRSPRAFLCTTCSSFPPPLQLSCQEGNWVCILSSITPSLSSTFRDLKEGLYKTACNREMKRWWDTDKHFVYITYICFSTSLNGACSTCFCHASMAKNKGMGLKEFFYVLARINFVFPCLTFNSRKTWV